MPLRSILHISAHSVQILVSTILVGILGFFALTRTQVGRDGLRHQLTEQFSSRFDGRLEIDQLRGNLVNDLFASGVRLYDPEGRLVVSVDSLVARPRWRDLFGRGISLGRLALYRPNVHLAWDEAGALTLAQAVRNAATGTSAGDPWSVSGVSVTIEDGTLRTQNQGPEPVLISVGSTFDFGNAFISSVHVKATVEWGREARVVELLSASIGESSLGLELHSLRGQFVLDQDGVELNQMEVHLSETRIAGSASVSGLAAFRRGDASSVLVEANVSGANLDADEIRRILPRYPLEDVIQASLRVHGPFSALVVEELGVARGHSVLVLGGTVVGLPEHADFDLTIEESTFDVHDLIAVAPFLDLSPYAHLTPVRIRAHSEGLLGRAANGAWLAPTGRADFVLQSSAGTASVKVDFATGSNERIAFDLDVDADEIDLAAILDDEALRSRISGKLAVIGEVGKWDHSAASVSLHLGPSSLGPHHVDSLRAHFTLDDRHVRGTLLALRGQSRASLGLDASLNSDPEFQLTARLRDVDVGDLLSSDVLQTALNVDVRVAGRGRSWHGFRGSVDLAMDSTTVTRGVHAAVLAPGKTSLRLSDGDPGRTILVVKGDVLEAELESDLSLDDVWANLSLWGQSLRGFIEREYLKPYPRLVDRAAEVDRAARLDMEERMRADALRALASRLDRDSLHVSGRVHLRDAATLAALIPGFPLLNDGLASTFTYRADSTSSVLHATMLADSLGAEQSFLRGLRAQIDLHGRLTPSRRQVWDLALDGQSAQIRIGNERIRRSRFAARLDRSGGDLAFVSGDTSSVELNVAASLRTLPDRTRLTVTDFRYATGDYAWTNTAEDLLDLYSNAVVAHDIRLQNDSKSSGFVQRVHLDGPVSSAEGDTLVVIAEHIALHQIANLLLGEAMVGGDVSGRIALTGGMRSPELTGNLDVAQLFFDNRLLGDLALQSSYVPGMPDVEVEARLRPSVHEPPPHPPGSARPVLVEQNELTIRGMVRMPQFDEELKAMQPSALDLTVHAERADAFFFEYIFDEIDSVDGYLTGDATISGTFGKPLFDGSFMLRDARFTVPDYNLAFKAEAETTIDPAGIHIQEGRLVDKTGGTGLIRGDILFNDYRYFSLGLAAHLTDVQIIDVMSARDLAFYGRIWASGNVTLTGPLHAALLQSSDVVTHPKSEIFIPLTETAESSDAGFIVFADSTGALPDLRALTERRSIIGHRPVGVRAFVDGLEMDLNIFAPPGSTVRLVIDPLLGDVMNAVSTGRIHLLRTEGEYYMYGALDVSSGDYLFTAGDVFMRRFLIDEGTIRWDGDPTDAQLNVMASYRTRASTAGLPGLSGSSSSASLIPLIVKLHIRGRVSTPAVDLSLALERTDRDVVGQRLEAILNDPERSTQYATSVLLTNTFLLTTDQFAESDQGRVGSRSQFAFNSVSQLVANQLNRYLSHALPNVDVSFGLQGERAQDLDVTYGVALRLMDERLIIRGEGVYQNDQQNAARGEFVVQVRLSPTVSVEVFYRREGDILSDQTLTNTTGAGVSYQTRFSSWQRVVQRLFGRSGRDEEDVDEGDGPELTDVAADAR